MNYKKGFSSYEDLLYPTVTLKTLILESPFFTGMWVP